MKRVIVRYKVQEGRGEENAALIRKVFAELAETNPAGLSYTAYVGDDQQTFVHIAQIDTADGSNPLLATAAFKAFTAQLPQRCAEPPITVHGTEVGSFNSLR